MYAGIDSSREETGELCLYFALNSVSNNSSGV